jgi:hypothetical protein
MTAGAKAAPPDYPRDPHELIRLLAQARTALENERALRLAAEKDAREWKREWELYDHAWTRSLGGKLFNKRHKIDALAMTTEWFVKGHAEWERLTKEMEERKRTEDLTKTLGWEGKLPNA